jgi:hypothetical protein
MQSGGFSRFVRDVRILVLWLAYASNAHCVELQDQAGAVKAWGVAERIDDTGSVPDVAMDESGNAVVAWWNVQSEGILSSRYVANERAWTPPEEIGLTDVGALDRLAVAIDASSRAVAVWAAFFVADNVWANRSMPDGSWDRVPTRLDSSEAATRWPADSGPHVSANASGAAMAIWVQIDDQDEHVWAARLAPGGSWRPAARVDRADPTRSHEPMVAVDEEGHAVAVWVAEEGATSAIWSNRYTVGVGWGGEPERVDTDDTGDAATPRIGVDARGHAIAVWSQGGDSAGIWANQYVPPDGWQSPVRIGGEGDVDAKTPDLAVLPDGRAFAVWSQSNGGADDIWANRFTGSSWRNAKPIERNPGAESTAPRVAGDRNGAAVAVWRQSGAGQSRIWASRTSSSGDWSTPVPIDAGEGNVGDPRVAADPDGNAVAVWAVTVGGNRGVWANRLE